MSTHYAPGTKYYCNIPSMREWDVELGQWKGQLCSNGPGKNYKIRASIM